MSHHSWIFECVFPANKDTVQHDHNATVRIRQLTWVPSNPQAPFRCAGCPNNVPCSKRIRSRPRRHSSWILPLLPWTWHFWQLQAGFCNYRVSIPSGLLVVSSWLDSGYLFSARISQMWCSVASSQGVFDFDLFLYWWYSFDRLIKEVSVRLLRCQVTLFPW